MSATIPFLIVNGVTSFTSIRVVNLEVLGTALVRESETVLGRITIVPPSAAPALVVRDATDTVDRIVMDEAGNLKLSPLTAGSILFAGSEGLVSQDNANLFWDNVNKRLGIMWSPPDYTLSVNGITATRGLFNFHNKDNPYSSTIKYYKSRGTYTSPTAVQSDDELGTIMWTGYDGASYVSSALIQAKVDGTPATNSIPSRIEFWTTRVGATGYSLRMVIKNDGKLGIGTSAPEFLVDSRGDVCVNRVANADSTNTLRNSFNLVLRGAYWTGSASANWDVAIFHRMLSTAPTSEIVFQIAGADKAVLRDTGEFLKAVLNGLRNYAGSSKTVTETVLTLKDEVGPLADRVSLIPMSIEYSADNPSLSGVTLTVVCRAVYTDGTSTDLRSDSVAAGGTLSVSFTPDGLYKLLSDGKVLQKIQLLAYCSATPAVGYEPTVTLTKVAGVSF